MFSLRSSVVSFLDYRLKDLTDEIAVFVTLLCSNERSVLRGQTGTSLFWAISGHKLDFFSRADYNSRKSNKNRCLFHLLSVMNQLTENKQNTMILLTCDFHIKTKSSRTAKICLKIVFTAYWLSWILPTSYHGSDIIQLQTVENQHDSPLITILTWFSCGLF